MVKRGFLAAAICALVLPVSASGVALAAGPEEERLLGSDREEQQFADLLPFTRALAVSGKVQGSLADSTSAAGVPPAAMLEAESVLTEVHAKAVNALLDKAGLAARDVGLIGFHGQTILHRPDQRVTYQLGNGALMAERLGIDVINRFRDADLTAGEPIELLDTDFVQYGSEPLMAHVTVS